MKLACFFSEPWDHLVASAGGSSQIAWRCRSPSSCHACRWKQRWRSKSGFMFGFPARPFHDGFLIIDHAQVLFRSLDSSLTFLQSGKHSFVSCMGSQRWNKKNILKVVTSRKSSTSWTVINMFWWTWSLVIQHLSFIDHASWSSLSLMKMMSVINTIVILCFHQHHENLTEHMVCDPPRPPSFSKMISDGLKVGAPSQLSSKRTRLSGDRWWVYLSGVTKRYTRHATADRSFSNLPSWASGFWSWVVSELYVPKTNYCKLLQLF